MNDGSGHSSWFPAERRWLARQPAGVLCAYLDAITHLDLEAGEFLALQGWVLARLGARRG
jgi:hypothetical protein